MSNPTDRPCTYTIVTKDGKYRWQRNDGEPLSPEFNSQQECADWTGPKLSRDELQKHGLKW